MKQCMYLRKEVLGAGRTLKWATFGSWCWHSACAHWFERFWLLALICAKCCPSLCLDAFSSVFCGLIRVSEQHRHESKSYFAQSIKVLKEFKKDTVFEACVQILRCSASNAYRFGKLWSQHQGSQGFDVETRRWKVGRRISALNSWFSINFE